MRQTQAFVLQSMHRICDAAPIDVCKIVALDASGVRLVYVYRSPHLLGLGANINDCACASQPGTAQTDRSLFSSELHVLRQGHTACGTDCVPEQASVCSSQHRATHGVVDVNLPAFCH